MIAILAIALALTFFNLTREIVYLSPGSRYWIEVSAKGIELASPLARRRYRRQEVSAFVVRSLPLRSWRVLRVIARGARWRWIWIRSDDFATGLAPSRKEAAEIFASTLNDLLGQVDAGQDATVRIPAGLKVEAVTEGNRESPVKAAPVVRRL